MIHDPLPSVAHLKLGRVDQVIVERSRFRPPTRMHKEVIEAGMVIDHPIFRKRGLIPFHYVVQ